MTDTAQSFPEGGEWRVVELHGDSVAADGPVAVGTGIRNLQGMCELANAQAVRIRRLEAELERIVLAYEGEPPVGMQARYIERIARDALEGGSHE